MKKTALLAGAALAFTALSAGYSMDFGALITNDSSFTGNKMSKLMLDQNDTASGWIKIPFGRNVYIATEGMYRFEKKWIDVFDVEENAKDAEDESAFDISLAKLQVQKEVANGGSLLFSLGRFATSDATGVIYAQMADGATFAYASPVVNVSLYGAYTGLLNTRTVSILNESGFAAEDITKKYDFAEKYAVGAATLSLPNIVGSQTATVQALGAFRLEEESFNRMYATLALNGPILPRLFYTLSSTLGYRSYDGDGDISNLSKASLVLYTSAKALTFTLSGVYASGAQGPFKSFECITSQSAVKALDGRTEYTDVLKGGLFASIKPCRNLFIAAGAEAVCTAAEDTPEYEGFQWQANAAWQIVSDVSLNLSAYEYRDNDDDSRNKSNVALSCAIAF